MALAGARMEVWDWDLRERRLLLGSEAARRTGVPPTVEGTVAELVGRLVHPEERRAVEERLRPVLQGHADEFVSEHRAPGLAGAWIWVNITGRVTERGPDGEPRRLTGTIRDVTAERDLRTRLERAERLTSLGTLAAGVAHEVNNPLAYVAANLAFLREELGRQDSRATRDELSQAIEESLAGISRVRETVTGLERFASPAEATPPAPVDVGAELSAALGLARHELTRRARLEVDVPSSLPPVVADAGALRQVFVNLLVNAAQAIPEGDPGRHRVGVSARAEAGRLVLEVADSGAGIPAAVLPRIFDPFFTTKPVGTGTGLGLSVCHGIVNALGGTIEVESEVGKGSRFRVLLPVVRPMPAAPAAAPTAARARVLIVDDEPFVGRALGRILASAHDVTVTTSPLEALARFEAGERWDVMLCDLMMPELTGMELEARIAVAAPEMVGRIVFMTGGAFTAAAREFVDSGRPCIEKPIDPAALRTLVARRVGLA
jgi:signal transduction histidine kinase